MPSMEHMSYRKYYETMNPENEENYDLMLQKKKKKFEVLGCFCQSFPQYNHYLENVTKSLSFLDHEGFLHLFLFFIYFLFIFYLFFYFNFNFYFYLFILFFIFIYFFIYFYFIYFYFIYYFY